MSKQKRREVLKIIEDHPRITGFGIHDILMRRSWAAKWFGAHSLLSIIFGPGSFTLYITLMELEKDGLIRSEWGEATKERGWKRPRHYWAIKP